MNVSVVGAGRVGTAMAVLLGRAGYRIAAVSGRGRTRDRAARFLPGVPFLGPSESCRLGELVLIGVPDDAIVSMVGSLAEAGSFREGGSVAHLSGASGLDVLAPARRAGAHTLVLHPLQTFPDVAGALERIPGSAMAVTASDPETRTLGERISHDLGARPFPLADEDRLLYHAAAVFASNYLIVTSAVAEELLRNAGVPGPIAVMLPLQRASIDNVERLGADDALTGPAVRGDAHTIERHLTTLQEHAPSTVRAYVELCRLAVEMGVRSGRLSDGDRRAVDEVLARWS